MSKRCLWLTIGAVAVAFAAWVYFNGFHIELIVSWRDILTYWPHFSGAVIIGLTLYSVKLGRQQRKAAIEEGMPELFLHFVVQGMRVLLILQNSGRRPAMNVSVTSVPPLRSTINDEVFLEGGHSSLPPKSPIVFRLASRHEVSEHDPSVPLDYDVKITYTDRLIHRPIRREQHLTLRDFLGTFATDFPATL